MGCVVVPELMDVSMRESSRLDKEGAFGNQITDGKCNFSVNRGDEPFGPGAGHLQFSTPFMYNVNIL